jgi:hypothetical protein
MWYSAGLCACLTEQKLSKGRRRRRRISQMSEQAPKVKNKAIPEWAQGLYYRQGIFSEVLVYHDEEALYIEIRGKDSGVVRFSFEMLETLTEVIEEEQQAQADSSPKK